MHDSRAKIAFFYKNDFLSLRIVQFSNESTGESCIKKFLCEVGKKCNQKLSLHWFCAQSCTENWPFLTLCFSLLLEN